MKSLFILTISIALQCVQSFTWSGFTLFKTASSVTQIKQTQLQMSKAHTLNHVKAKYDGRFDLTSMIEENEVNQIATGDLFEEADREAVDPPKVGKSIRTLYILCLYQIM